MFVHAFALIFALNSARRVDSGISILGQHMIQKCQQSSGFVLSSIDMTVRRFQECQDEIARAISSQELL